MEFGRAIPSDSALPRSRWTAWVRVTRQVRLVGPPKEADAAAAAAALADGDGDGFERATILRERLGWSIKAGYALSQLEDKDAFVAAERWWNAKPTGLWVNAWPHQGDAPVGSTVLVESPLARQPPPPSDVSESASVSHPPSAVLSSMALNTVVKRPPSTNPIVGLTRRAGAESSFGVALQRAIALYAICQELHCEYVQPLHPPHGTPPSHPMGPHPHTPLRVRATGTPQPQPSPSTLTRNRTPQPQPSPSTRTLVPSTCLVRQVRAHAAREHPVPRPALPGTQLTD
jgi:hypothetical protein